MFIAFSEEKSGFFTNYQIIHGIFGVIIIANIIRKLNTNIEINGKIISSRIQIF